MSLPGNKLAAPRVLTSQPAPSPHLLFLPANGGWAMHAWIAEELATLDLGDARLDRRCHVVLDRLFCKPSLSIPAAAQGLAETMAAYRFFANDRVDDYELLRPHREATCQRMRQHPVVLLVQDTTELDYTRPQEVVTGAGPLTYASRSGFHSHVQLAVTPQRLCLGAIDVETWGRDPEDFGKRRQRRYQPIQAKESWRWVQGFQRACEVAEQLPDTQIVSIADAEGDVYECFTAPDAITTHPKAHWIVRACQDRRLTTDGPQRKVWDALANAPLLGTVTMKITRKKGRRQRTATMEVRSATLGLQPPERLGGDAPLPPIQINAVLIREVHPPEGEEAVEWLLLTDLPVATFAQAVTITDYYACRWQIEVFFKVLKSGCQVEKLQFESAERLRPCLALYMIVAWRVLYVTMLGRDCPELPCDTVFADDEWKSVWAVVKRQPTPTTPPTLAEFLLLVGELGGYLGRSGDGPLGPQRTWIGLQRTVDFAIAWQTFGPEAAKAALR